MDEEENPQSGARGETGNGTPGDDSADADTDTGTDADDTPSNDASGGDGSADSFAVGDDVSLEDIDIQAGIGPDAGASDASDEGLDQHKDPDAGLDKVVFNNDEKSKGLFNDLLAGEPIFKNKEVLRPSYTPHEPLRRTGQINQMATIPVSVLRGETPSNILTYGKTRTGKTTSAKFVSQELESAFQKYDMPCEAEYISYEVTDTQHRVFAQLANKFIEKNVERIEAEQRRLDEMHTRAAEDPDALEETPYDSITEVDERTAELDDNADETKTVPMTGWLTDRVYTTFFNAIDYKERVVVTMLDEVDKLVEKSSDDTLYNLSRMNSELDNFHISIMGISNDLKFTDFLDLRAKLSLGEEEIAFLPYDINQFCDTLQRRADMAFKSDALTGDVIPLCAAFAAQEHDDARRVFDLLCTVDEFTEHGQANTVEEVHIRQTQDKIKLDRAVKVIHTLPMQSKIILFAIIPLEKNGARSINAGEVFSTYKRLCEEIDANVSTQRRVTDLISEFDMFGIVNIAIVLRGRYSWTKGISLPVPVGETGAVLLTDLRLGDIEGTQPFTQARLDN